MEQRRLACSDFPRQRDEALALLDAIDQSRERFPMRRRRVQESRVGRRVERPFFEPVEVQIHGNLSQDWPGVRRRSSCSFPVATKYEAPTMSNRLNATASPVKAARHRLRRT